MIEHQCISRRLFRDFPTCKRKAYLKLPGKHGSKADYEELQLRMQQTRGTGQGLSI